MDEKIFNDIYKRHLETLKNKDKKANKTIICFSGLSGSGKTTLSKRIESEFSAVRISSDEIREIIGKLGYADKFPEQHKISSNYLRWFLKNYKLENKFIILDNDISGKYADIKQILSPQSWKFFIIQITLDPSLAIQRVIKREDKFEGFQDNLHERIRTYNEFNSKNTANIIVDNTKELNFEDILANIKKFLKN